MTEPDPPPPLEVALEDVAASLRLSAQTMADVLPSRAKAQLIQKGIIAGTISAIASFLALAAILAVIFIVILPGQYQTHKTLDLVQQATSPANAQAGAQQTVVAENHIIVCDENHTDRIVETLLKLAVEPVAAGCPADHLPATH